MGLVEYKANSAHTELPHWGKGTLQSKRTMSILNYSWKLNTSLNSTVTKLLYYVNKP